MNPSIAARPLGSGLILAAIAAAYGLEFARGAVANDGALLALGALPDTAELHGESWRWRASGGMFGLLGLCLVLVQFPPPARRLTRVAIGVVTAGGLVYSLRPGISLVGHLAGLAVGGFAAFLFRVWARRRRTPVANRA